MVTGALRLPIKGGTDRMPVLLFQSVLGDRPLPFRQNTSGRPLVRGKPTHVYLFVRLHQYPHRIRFKNRVDFGSDCKLEIVDGVLSELHDHLGPSFSDR